MNIEFSDAYLGQLWERIDWSAAEAKLYAFQRRLSLAAFRKNSKEVTDLQKRLVRDLDIKCLAVRHVVNSTSSPGVDGVKWRTSTVAHLQGLSCFPHAADLDYSEEYREGAAPAASNLS